ncbi:MAG: metallophosphoesterase family protein [Campylobacterota bacterium]|nr:metallophosphoesterase family protein [Campylobacterota bacterium]
MKILHTTDLHFNKKWFEWIVNEQNNYDAICITGDFLDVDNDEPIQKQASWVKSWLKEFKKPILTCTGNHDSVDFDNGDWLVSSEYAYSDGSKPTINGVKFGCISYGTPDFFEYDECDVLLYHLPPSSTKTAITKDSNKDFGDQELSRLLKNGMLDAKYLLCGHIHNAKSTEDKINHTIILNPASVADKDIPPYKIIEISIK